MLPGNILACSWSYTIWQNRDRNADPYYRFIQNGNFGYIDRNGKIVVQATSRLKYSSDEFHDGLLLTGVSEGPYIDANGNTVLETGLERNWDFSEGLAAALKDNKWGYIDKTGKFVIQPTFDTYPLGYVYPFADGMAMINVGDHYGYIDTTGKVKIPPTIPWATSFHEGIARVIASGPCVRSSFENPCDFGEQIGKKLGEQESPNCKFGFINKSGGSIGADQFDGALDFSEGLAAVQKDNKWGFINKNGDQVIPFKYELVSSFSDGLARIANGGFFEAKKWGYIDTTGKTVIPIQFEDADDFSDGLAPVRLNSGKEPERWCYINKTGKCVFKDEFALASPFFQGIAHVKHIEKSNRYDSHYKYGIFSYIDTKGRTIFSYENRR